MLQAADMSYCAFSIFTYRMHSRAFAVDVEIYFMLLCYIPYPLSLSIISFSLVYYRLPVDKG